MSMVPKAVSQEPPKFVRNARYWPLTQVGLPNLSMPHFTPNSTGMRNTLSSLRSFWEVRENQSQDAGPKVVPFLLLSSWSLPIWGAHGSYPTFCHPLPPATISPLHSSAWP